jgi:hypothetical protein
MISIILRKKQTLYINCHENKVKENREYEAYRKETSMTNFSDTRSKSSGLLMSTVAVKMILPFQLNARRNRIIKQAYLVNFRSFSKFVKQVANFPFWR